MDAQGVSGGCDADCPGGSPPVTYFGGIANAMKSGVLPVEMVDQSLTRVFTAAISLGLLDDPTASPYLLRGMHMSFIWINLPLSLGLFLTY
jgi:hypothetical protein